MDRTGRTALGLRRDNFKIFEDGAPQEIASFSNEDVPSSVGLVFDVSGSMKDKMRTAREAAHRLLETAIPEDEFFLITFSDRPAVEVDVTTDTSRINSRLLFVKPGGATALVDAVYLALNRLRTARGPRKALVVVSDGGDNNSRYSQGELYSYAVEADAQIHALGIPGNLRSGLNGFGILENLSSATGGLHFEAWNLKDLPSQAAKIGMALHDQYVLGYRPSPPMADSKYHKIQVKLDLPAGSAPLRVYARQTYRSPER
jgi:Ca-activated chloride channel family protein